MYTYANQVYWVITSLNDRRVKLREIADILKMSRERVRHILHENLHMKKLCARWVPCSLAIDQKQQRVDDSECCLKFYQCNSKEFLYWYVTMDKSRIHHYTPESSKQSVQWLRPGKAAQSDQGRKNSRESSVRVCWDAHGIIFINYLEKEKTITEEYYVAL